MDEHLKTLELDPTAERSAQKSWRSKISRPRFSFAAINELFFLSLRRHQRRCIYPSEAMGKSSKAKKEKKKDFQKAKLKVGKTKPKASNATDTSFKALCKSIIVLYRLKLR
jgi:hypothetical protein